MRRIVSTFFPFFLFPINHGRCGVSFALNPQQSKIKLRQCTSFLKREKQIDSDDDNQSYYKLPRIHWTGKLQENWDITITDGAKNNAHYLSNVMRVKAGYMFRIFNAIHGEYLCRIKNISKSKHTDSINCEVIRQLRQTQGTYTLPCTLFCAPIKKPRMKILLEKVTELGVQDVVFIVTQNTIVADRMEKGETDTFRSFQTILVQSAEQSERLSVPTLHTYVTLSDLLKFIPQLSSESASTDSNIRTNVMSSFQTIFVCVERSAANNEHLLTSFQQFISSSCSISGSSYSSTSIDSSSGGGGSSSSSNSSGRSSSSSSSCDSSSSSSSSKNHGLQPFALLIGPEGGFTAEEMEQIRLVQATNPSRIRLVSLGETVLRSETAAISALSVVSAVVDTVVHR